MGASAGRRPRLSRYARSSHFASRPIRATIACAWFSPPPMRPAIRKRRSRRRLFRARSLVDTHATIKGMETEELASLIKNANDLWREILSVTESPDSPLPPGWIDPFIRIASRNSITTTVSKFHFPSRVRLRDPSAPPLLLARCYWVGQKFVKLHGALLFGTDERATGRGAVNTARHARPRGLRVAPRRPWRCPSASV